MGVFSLDIGHCLGRKDYDVAESDSSSSHKRKQYLFCVTYYKGHLQSLWTHLTTPSQNFVEVQRVSFSKYLHWQAMHFLQHSTHFSKMCCRPLITLKFLASELLFHGWKAQKLNGARSGLYGGCSNGVPLMHFLQTEHRIQFTSCPM
jgi:sarcosine oxidase delta subunit